MAELIEDVKPKNDDFLLEFVNHYGAGSDKEYSSEQQKSIYSTTEQVYIESLSVPLPDWASFDKTIQKNKKESAPALVVIELQSQENYQVLIDNMKSYNINYTALNKNDNVFAYII